MLEGSIELPVIQQVLRQAADGIQVVVVEFRRLTVRGNSVLILLLLLVGIRERRVKLGGTRGIGHCGQHIHGTLGVSLFVIEVGQHGRGFFRIGLQLYRRAELCFRLLQIVVQPAQEPEQKVIVNALRLQADDLLILFHRTLQNI